jgi:hypothetical protein
VPDGDPDLLSVGLFWKFKALFTVALEPLAARDFTVRLHLM